METYGILTLLPPIATVVVAAITKRAWEPLLIGATLGYIISDGFGFFWPWMDGIYQVFDSDGVWLMLCVAFIGVFCVMLERSGGSVGFGKLAAKLAKKDKQSLLVGWFLGVILFIDDYCNTMTTTSAIKPLTDQQGVPREMVAYVTNSTAAPACILIPLSSWYVFFGGLIDEEKCLKAIDGIGDGFSIYIHAIPNMFYGWFAPIVVLLVIFELLPKFGRMKAAYQRVKDTGEVYAKANEKFNAQAADEEEGPKPNAWNFIIPLVVVIVVTLIWGDLLVGLIIATAVSVVLFTVNKTMKMTAAIDCIFDGVAEMAQMFFIMMTAIFVKISMDNIGLPVYVVETVSPYLNQVTFPVVVFLVVGILAFFTGNNWGIPAVTIPMVAPLAVACNADIYLTMGALLSGAAFGCHACFFSDTTVLTAKCSGITNMEHALSQLPYALIAAGLSCVFFIAFSVTGFNFFHY